MGQDYSMSRERGFDLLMTGLVRGFPLAHIQLVWVWSLCLIPGQSRGLVRKQMLPKKCYLIFESKDMNMEILVGAGVKSCFQSTGRLILSHIKQT